MLTPSARDLNDLYVGGMRSLIDRGELAEGDVVVLLSGSVVAGTGANTMKIYRVGTADLSEDAMARYLPSLLIARSFISQAILPKRWTFLPVAAFHSTGDRPSSATVATIFPSPLNATFTSDLAG